MCNCNCNCCDRLIKSISVEISGVSPNQILQITVPPHTFTENYKFCLVVCQTIPTNNYPVEIISGTETISVLNRIGNTLRGDQIKSRKKYSAVFGADESHILIRSCVPETTAL